MKKSIIAVFILMASHVLFAQGDAMPVSFLRDLKLQADVVYGRKCGMALTFDVITPPNSNGAAVLFMNSGGFASGKMRFIDADRDMQYRYLKKEELVILPERFSYPPLGQFSMDDLLLKGFTVFDIRHGSDPQFTLDEITSDCRQAVVFIREHADHFGINPERMGVFGASSGGYLASFLGTDTLGIKSVAVFYPVGFDLMRIKRDFPDVYNGFACFHLDTAVLDSLSVKRRISAGSARFLIIYGKDDFPFVTLDSEEQAAALKKAGVTCKLISLEGTGHEFRGKDGYNAKYGDFARVTVAEWFESTLAGGK